MKKYLSLILCLLMVLSVFAGCGGTETPEKAESAPAAEAPAAESKTEAAEEAAPAEVTYKKDLIVGIEGKLVDLKDTISSFKKIISGEGDDLPEAAFYMVGDFDSARAKGEKILAELGGS